MSQSASQPPIERLSEQLTTGTERLLRDVETGASDETVAATATELREVVEEFDDLLGTIDLEKLPDVVEVSALPELLDLEELPDAIREKDPDAAIDLRALRRVIKLRELWNAVDLVDFTRESREFESELEDVVGPDALESSDDSEAAADLEAFTEEAKGDATNAAFQQELQERIETARNAVVEGHAKFEELYESNQRGSGYAGRRPISNNPTAVSLVPPGPLPTSVSTRVSTVPTNVRQAKIDASPRIYGRRWKRASSRR